MDVKYTSLRCFWLSKCLILLSIVVFNTSCEKENIVIEKENNTKQVCSFQDYSFIDNIKCYDVNGNSYDSSSYIYSRKDFIFTDEYEYFFKKIVINADNTAKMYRSAEDTINVKYGYITQKNDTLYFYYNNPHDFDRFFFKGLIVNHQLRLQGYVSRYYVCTSDGNNNAIVKGKTSGYGIPSLKNLLKDFPKLYYDNFIMKTENMYYQKFDLVYEITTE
jgi:hypothetical protein